MNYTHNEGGGQYYLNVVVVFIFLWGGDNFSLEILLVGECGDIVDLNTRS